MKNKSLLLSFVLLTISCTQEKYSLLLVVGDERVIDGKEILASSDKSAVLKSVKCLDDCISELQKTDSQGLLYSDFVYNLKKAKDGEIIWGYFLGKKYGEIERLFVYEPKFLSIKQSKINEEQGKACKDARFGMKRKEVKNLPSFSEYISSNANDYTRFNTLATDNEIIGDEKYHVRMAFNKKNDELFYVGIYSPVYSASDYYGIIRPSIEEKKEMYEKDYGAPNVIKGDIDTEYSWRIGTKIIRLSLESRHYGEYNIQILIIDSERLRQYGDKID